jgi:DNA-binding transcriptional MocR family regulator
MTSILLDAIDKADPADLYEQVAGEIRRLSQTAKPNPRTAPAGKDLAAVLGVSANTVLRARRVLRDEGLQSSAAVAASPSLAPRTKRSHPTRQRLVDFARLRATDQTTHQIIQTRLVEHGTLSWASVQECLSVCAAGWTRRRSDVSDCSRSPIPFDPQTRRSGARSSSSQNSRSVTRSDEP